MKIPQNISHNTNCLLINWSGLSAYRFSASLRALEHCCLDLLKDTFCQQQLFIDNCFGLFVGLNTDMLYGRVFKAFIAVKELSLIHI